MRIAIVSSDWRPTGGIATYTRSLASALGHAGHDVFVLHGGGTSDRRSGALEFAAVPGAFFPGADVRPELAQRAIARLQAAHPEIVHIVSNNNFAFEDDVRARWPAVKTFHVHEYCPAGTKYHFALDRPCHVRTGAMCVPRMGYLRCTPSRRPQVWWRLYRHTSRANASHARFRRLIVCSAHVKAQAVFSGFDERRIDVVPYFTDASVPAAPAQSRDVLFVGRLVREKGADLLLDALRRMATDWTATIVGDGPEAAALRRRASELEVADRVVFSGWLDGAPLADAYRRAAVVAMPSRWPEPSGIVGLEAMAHGRPVVAFDTGGIPEWLADGVGGWLVPRGDIGRLSERIEHALTNPVDATRAAALGRDRVAREFSAGAHLARLFAVYDEVRRAR